jgi:hypothetical protein
MQTAIRLASLNYVVWLRALWEHTRNGERALSGLYSTVYRTIWYDCAIMHRKKNRTLGNDLQCVVWLLIHSSHSVHKNGRQVNHTVPCIILHGMTSLYFIVQCAIRYTATYSTVFQFVWCCIIQTAICAVTLLSVVWLRTHREHIRNWEWALSVPFSTVYHTIRYDCAVLLRAVRHTLGCFMQYRES